MIFYRIDKYNNLFLLTVFKMNRIIALTSITTGVRAELRGGVRYQSTRTKQQQIVRERLMENTICFKERDNIRILCRCNKAWDIFGENPFDAIHDPYLGTIEGKYCDVVDIALQHPQFIILGQGGEIRENSGTKVNTIENNKDNDERRFHVPLLDLL